MVATLTRIFGLEHLTLAEDVVQEALALRTCPFYSVPENPSAWIMRTSRNLALDVVRREKVFREKEAEIVHLMMCGETGVRTRNGNLSTVRSSLLCRLSPHELFRRSFLPSQALFSFHRAEFLQTTDRQWALTGMVSSTSWKAPPNL